MALAIVSLAYVGAQSLNISLSTALATCLFFGSLAAYNFIKYGVGAKYYLKVSKRAFIPIQILSILAAIFASFGVLELPELSFVLLLFMVVCTSFYALPLLPSRKNLRAVAGLKIYIVAAVWAMATVLLPLSTLGMAALFKPTAYKEIATDSLGVLVAASAPEGPFFWVGVLGLFLAHFVLVLILMIPFEIRDSKQDQLGLKTIVQQCGLFRAKVLGYIFLGCYVLLQVFNAAIFSWTIALIGLQFLLAFALFAAIYKSNVARSYYFTNFWVESIPIVYALLWFFIA